MKRSTGRRVRRRGAVALNLALVLVVSGVVGYAFAAEGNKTHRTDLNDGGIWVTDGRLSSFGRVNKPIGQIDSIVYTDVHSDVDVVQQDSAVIGENLSTRRLLVLDPTTAAPVDGQQALLPRAAQVQLAGGTLASLDPTSGEVWATRVDPEGALPEVTGLDAESPALAGVGGDAGLAVTQGGTILVASGANDTLSSLAPTRTGFGVPDTADLDVAVTGAPSVTAVGETPVVLDPDTGELQVIGGARAVVDAGAVLQQPGPAATSVLVETPTALVGVDLETGALRTIATVPSGSPTAPVRLAACVFGAWSGGRGYVSSQCGDSEAATLTLNRHTSDLVFRVNRGQILLNDRLNGAVWNIDDQPTKIDNWEAFRNPDRDDQKESQQHNTNPGDRRPPKARNDKFGARPGRTTVTHPLDNDSAAAGRMLAVSSVEQLSGADASPTISPDGQTIQFQQPTSARGSATYEYFISDGRRDVSAHATITLTSRPRGNYPPTLRSGFHQRTWPVPPNGTITLPVLTDWRDPSDGDALDVVSAVTDAAADAGAAVQTTTDGRIRVTAPGKSGPMKVTYTVSDGRSEPVEQDITFRVQDPDTDQAVAASAQPDIVSAEAGEWVTIRPLANDLPGADPFAPDAQLKLGGAVTGSGGAEVSTDLSAGTVSFKAANAKSFLLDYDVAYGDAPLAAGRIRVDVHEDENHGPVAMPDTATLYGPSPTIVDALVNDYDPRGGVLMIESARALSGDQLDVAVIDGRWVRISARQGEIRPSPQVVRYTASNGSRSVVGEIQVTQRPVPVDNAPVTEPDRVTVRAGSSASIAVLDNDFSPSGDQLTLVSDLAGVDPGRLEVTGPGGRVGRGDAFVAGRVVRYVAPADATTGDTYTVTYVASNAQGETTPGRVEVTVLPVGKHNQPPEAPVLEGRVVAGDTVTLRLPGSGLDPDGDSVTILGLGSAPSLGRVVKVGANSVDYQAYPSGAGTDEFDYLITDAQGARATGTVRVAVIVPGPPQPPLAVADVVTVEPGRQATVYPMANDFVAAGDNAHVELVDPPPGVTLGEDGGPVVVDVPGGEAGRTTEIVYRLTNGLDATQSTITVRSATPFNNPPVVFDAFGSTTDSAAVKVDVLKTAYDPDGPHAQLRIADVYAPDAQVSGGRITALRGDQPRVVPFRVEDANGGSATGNLYVPPTGTGLPFVKPNALIRLEPGLQRKVPLADVVVNPSGGVLRLAPGAQVSGSPLGQITARAASPTELSVEGNTTYRGPGAVSVAVAPKGDRQPVVLSIPAQVGQNVPVLKCPADTIEIPQGTEKTFDITSLCHTYADPATLADLVYTATWSKPGSGLELRTPQGHQIVVGATGSARAGTEATLSVTGDDSRPGLIRLRVVEAPPPTMSPVTVSDLRAGESRTVDLAQYLTPGVPNPTSRVLSITPVSGRDVTASVVGNTQVSLAAGTKAHGAATFRVTMSDSGSGAPADRQASNLLTVDLLGVPDAPNAPVPTGALQSEAVHLTWRAPAANGSPIDRYELTASNGAKRSCPSTSCTFTGLANGTKYVFTVRAHNAVGWSDASPKSRSASPEGVPGPVSNIHLTKVADGKLDLAWDPPSVNGSHVDNYRVVWDGKTAYTHGEPFFHVYGLDNSRPYTFKIYAHNSADWGDGAQSVPFQSAGPPGKPNPPRVAARDAGSGNSAVLDVSWDAVTDTSAEPMLYTLYDNRTIVSGCAGEPILSCTITVPYDGATHVFTVEGSTAGQAGEVSDGSQPWQAIASPLAWGAWSWQATGRDGMAALDFNVPDSRGGESNIYVVLDGGSQLGPFSMDEGPQTKTISVGDNDRPHQVKLRVCNESPGKCSTSTEQSVQTWGPLVQSYLSPPEAQPNGSRMGWRITVDPNGAPVDVIISGSDFRPDQTVHIDQVDRTSFTLDPVDIGYDTTESINVKVVDSVRDRELPRRSANATTDPPPPAEVKVSRGARCQDGESNPCHPPGDGGEDCTDSACGFIVLKVSNFFGPVTCTLNAQGFGQIGKVENIADNSTIQTAIYFGNTGTIVKAQCTSGSSGTSANSSFAWPN
ncbi:MAG: Ig-like domain-containing protein [Nocardioidaceae bacterium]